MSILSYNSITLPYSDVTSFDQQVMYEDSRTDWFCTRYDIAVRCLINVNYISLIAPALVEGSNPTTTNPAAIMTYLRKRLMAPRNRLSFTFNGIDLVPQTQLALGSNTRLPGTVDAQNGPMPQNVSFGLMTGTTFTLNYRIIAHYWENNATGPFPLPNQTGSSVLYNRWTETVDIDNLNVTTRTREGKFVIRSDNADGQIADYYRDQFAIVGVPLRFLRLSSQYMQSPDGLALAYRVVDREQFKMPPNPAYYSDGEYIESFPLDGAWRFGDFRLLLRGANDTSQSELINTALVISKQKYDRVLGGDSSLLSFAVNTSLRVNAYQNEIELRTRRQYAASPSLVGGYAAFAGQDLVYQPGTDDKTNSQLKKTYPTGGTANRLLVAAAYFDPSLDTASNAISASDSQSFAGTLIGQAGTNLEAN